MPLPHTMRPTPPPAIQRSSGNRKRVLSAAIVAALFGGLAASVPLTTDAAQASAGGALNTAPVTGALSSVVASGSASGLLGNALKLPVHLGDKGSYVLPGSTVPIADTTGNGINSQTLPAGDILGIITDPKKGSVESEEGRGLSIAGGTDQVLRTPSGLNSATSVNGLQISLEAMNPKVATVLERDVIATVANVTTDSSIALDGSTQVQTNVTDLTMLGEDIELVDGRLAAPEVRTLAIDHTDPVQLMRALGVKEKDIDEYKGYIKSGRLQGTFTLTAETPASGGLLITANLQIHAQVDGGFAGKADLQANNRVLEVNVATTHGATAPAAMTPQADSLDGRSAETGQVIQLHGRGFVVNGTTIQLDGSSIPVHDVSADGQLASFTVPADLPGGSYGVTLSTAGGTAQLGSLRVIGEDTIALRLDSLAPETAPDGATIELTGAGLIGEQLTVAVVDSSQQRFVIKPAAITTSPSGLSLQLRLPEGLALGAARVIVELPGELAELPLNIVPLELAPIAASGNAAVLGLGTEQFAVPLTVDNSGAMTWTAPTLINPAGTSGSEQFAKLGSPEADSIGSGAQQLTEAGMSASTERNFESLKASASAQQFSLSLPEPWGAFFGISDIATAQSLSSSASANAGTSAKAAVQIESLSVLGQPVELVDGKVVTAQTFTLNRNGDWLKQQRAMDGVFFASAEQAYDRLKSATSASLSITINPSEVVESGSDASATAFTVDANMSYRYEGENSGILKTRARHGSGGDRNGQLVDLFNATVGQVSVSAPTAVQPDVISADPRVIDEGDKVTLTGRAFTAESTVLIDKLEVQPDSVNANGTELQFTVPERKKFVGEQPEGEPAEGEQPEQKLYESIVRVRTAAGESKTSRALIWTAAPEFAAQPQNASATLGETVRFAVEVQGSPAPTLQWQQEVAGKWQPLAEQNTESLTVTATAELNGARYRVVATNDLGEVNSEVATLQIVSAPVINQGPANLTVAAGESAEFNVDATMLPAGTITWQIDRGEGFVALPDAHEATLRFIAERNDHAASLRAVLSNSLGTTVSDAAQLTVLYGPVVTTNPAPVKVREGEAAVFSASADSNPSASVRWEFRHRLGGVWTPLDTVTHPSALTTELSLPSELSFDGLLFRAVFSADGFDPVASEPAQISVTPATTEPGATGVSSLSSPLSIGVSALLGKGEASGGAMSGFINGYLAKGVEITEPGLFKLAEAGKPEQPGAEVTEHPAGVPAGNKIGDIDAGAEYGAVTVTNDWSTEGIRSATTVESIRIDHRMLDAKGRVGQVIGLDEIVFAEQLSSEANALLDNDAGTTSSASIARLRVLGTELTAADGFVNGRLAKPVTKTLELQLDDPNEVTKSLGLDLSGYLSNPVSGQATARVEVTVSQPKETTRDTAFAVGLHVTAKISLDVELETEGSDRGVFEKIGLSTAGLQETVSMNVAASTVARNGAKLPDPDEGGGEGPIEEPFPSEEPVAPIPVTSYAPTRVPDRVVATPTADPATGRSITWRTAAEVEQATIEYRPAGASAAATVLPATTSDAVTRTASDSSGTQSWSIRSHRVTLSGLSPATEYEFRVGDGAESWSPWRAFTTASAAADPFTFLYVGDAQNDLRAYWGAAVRSAMSTVPEAEMMLHAGDLINNGDNDVEWAEWFDAAPDDFATKLQLPVAGNHELKTADGLISGIWRDSFTVPGNGPQPNPAADACTLAYERHIASNLAGVVYYFDYQGVRFVTLTGTWSNAVLTPPSDQLAAAGCDSAASANAILVWLNLQSRWLDQVLTENPHQWSVVSMHEPLYSVSLGRDNSFLRDEFGPVFEKHNVDLVLQGHDHSYGRGHLFSNEVAGHPGLSTGPEYAVSVLGPKDYVADLSDDNNWSKNGANRVAVYEKTRTFQSISVDGGHLSYTAHKYPSGEVVDSFEICKAPDGGKFVASGGVALPENCSLETDGGPGEPGEGGDEPLISLSTDRVQPGSKLSVALSKMPAGKFEIGIASTYQALASVDVVNGSAAATVTVPANIRPGVHHIQVRDSSGALLAQAAVTVVATASEAGVVEPKLSNTGSDIGLPITLAAVLLGAALIVFYLRRRARHMAELD